MYKFIPQYKRVLDNHLIPNKHENKNNHQTAQYAIVAISREWYNGSYTMAAKPVKSLELHDTMIQFLLAGNGGKLEKDESRNPEPEPEPKSSE